MKKGFTLIELLGVIVVLGIISLITTPQIINQIRNIRDEISSDTLRLIYSATNRFIDENRNTYPKIEDREYCIPLVTIINSGMLPNPLIDPFSNREIDENKEVHVMVNAIYDIEFLLVEQGACGYIDPSGAPKPYLIDNMIPVEYDFSESVWVKADVNSDWFNYAEKRWANAVLLTPSSRGFYQNVSPGEIIDFDDVLGQFVWIPRYRYRILNSQFDDISDSNPAFDIIFEGVSTEKSEGSSNNEWITHPAFTFGTEELDGFWVGKYTTGYSGANSVAASQVSTPEINSAIVKPNSYAWRGISLSNAHIVATDMTEPGNIYGLLNSQVLSRLTRNVDWGAVAYLSRSIYGFEEQVWQNRNQNYLTGCASDSVIGSSTSVCRQYNTENGQKASTTGNVYGVYDMSGGAHEYVMGGTYTSGNSTVRLSSSGFTTAINNSDFEPFIDKYNYNTDVNNYSHSKLGDALGETIAWDDALRVAARGNSSSSWYIRGGRNSTNPGAGIFAFSATSGGPINSVGFRLLLHEK